MTRSIAGPLVLALGLALVPAAAGTGGEPDRSGKPQGVLDLPLVAEWKNFSRRDGLPADRAFAVRIDGRRVWVGTENGLARFEAGRWRSWGRAEGLPHPVVLSLDVSPRTGDLWIGTMGGLARFSGGRFDTFTQTDSGLPNDVVHAVRCDPDQAVVWAATAMGLGRLDLRTGEWSIFTHRNTPMHEPWTYSLAIGDGRLYVGAWGAGILEYDKAAGRWREYRDPDREFELDLFADDGPVSDVTAAVDFDDGILWAMTYTGGARYDGREWRSYFKADSGLASDFIQFVRARGPRAWIATDDGLSHTDGNDWVTYRRTENGSGEVLLFRDDRQIGRVETATAPAHNFILGVDASADQIWLATAAGVSRGVRVPGGPPARSLSSDREIASPPDREPAPARFRYAGTPDPLLPFREYLPYRDLFTSRVAFLGPGRDDPEPVDLDEIRLGFIGPLSRADLPDRRGGGRPAIPQEDTKARIGRRMLRAATLAVEEANRAGGVRGLPLRLIPRTDLVLWGQTSNELVGFVLEDRVWAVLSAVDSNHNHVLSRTALKLEIPVMNAGSTDPTLVEHTIPWLARCINDDRQNAYALLHEIFLRRDLRRVALLRSNDRDGRTGVVEFLQGARRIGRPVVLEKRFEPGDEDFRDSLRSIAAAGADGLVLWGNPREAAAIVRQVRASGSEIPVFGFDRMAHPDFLRAAGRAAEGVVVAATMNPDREDPRWRGFRDRYRTRWAEEPDSFAAHAYDGMNLLIEAVREAGLNRVRIRDALWSRETYDGVTGEIRFDTNMNDIGSPWLAVVRDGRFRYYRPEGQTGEATAIPPEAENRKRGTP